MAKGQLFNSVGALLALMAGSLLSAQPASAATVPAAPSNVAANTEGAHAVRITWQDNATNESGFVVADGNTAVDLVGANITSYTWTGLQAGTQYCFYVASKIYGPDGDPTGSGNEQSEWAGPACVTTPGKPINGSKASVSVAPAAVRSYESFQIQGHLWIPGGTVELSAPGGAVVAPSTLTVSEDGSFRLEVAMDVPPGNWTLNLVENVEGVTISKSVTLKVLQNPGRPAPKSAVIRVTRS